jgi:hypothetical protein
MIRFFRSNHRRAGSVCNHGARFVFSGPSPAGGRLRIARVSLCFFRSNHHQAGSVCNHGARFVFSVPLQAELHLKKLASVESNQRARRLSEGCVYTNTKAPRGNSNLQEPGCEARKVGARHFTIVGERPEPVWQPLTNIIININYPKPLLHMRGFRCILLTRDFDDALGPQPGSPRESDLFSYHSFGSRSGTYYWGRCNRPRLNGPIYRTIKATGGGSKPRTVAFLLSGRIECPLS